MECSFQIQFQKFLITSKYMSKLEYCRFFLILIKSTFPSHSLLIMFSWYFKLFFKYMMKGLNITYLKVPALENQHFYNAYFININWFRLRFYCLYLNFITELHCFLLNFHCKINRQILFDKIKINKTMT